MTSELVEAVERLQISANSGILSEKTIDDILDHRMPKLQGEQDHEVLKKAIEKEFLSPPRSFGPEWLNRLQRY